MGPPEQVAPGLRGGTGGHALREEDVASAAVERDDGLVLIAPIAPPRELRNPEHALVTVYWHGRTTAGTGARRVWASKRSARPLASRGIEVTDPFRAGDELPGGLIAFQTAGSSEGVY